jgi:hypothetical protein
MKGFDDVGMADGVGGGSAMSINNTGSKHPGLEAFSNAARDVKPDKGLCVSKSGEVKVVTLFKSTSSKENQNTREAFFHALSQRYPQSANTFQEDLLGNSRVPLTAREVTETLDMIELVSPHDEDVDPNIDLLNDTRAPDYVPAPPPGSLPAREEKKPAGDEKRHSLFSPRNLFSSSKKGRASAPLEDESGGETGEKEHFEKAPMMAMGLNQLNRILGENNNNNNNEYRRSNNNANDSDAGVQDKSGGHTTQERLDSLNRMFTTPKNLSVLQQSEVETLKKIVDLVDQKAGSLGDDSRAQAVQIAFDVMDGAGKSDDELPKLVDSAIESLNYSSASKFI